MKQLFCSESSAIEANHFRVLTVKIILKWLTGKLIVLWCFWVLHFVGLRILLLVSEEMVKRSSRNSSNIPTRVSYTKHRISSEKFGWIREHPEWNFEIFFGWNIVTQITNCCFYCFSQLGDNLIGSFNRPVINFVSAQYAEIEFVFPNGVANNKTISYIVVETIQVCSKTRHESFVHIKAFLNICAPHNELVGRKILTTNSDQKSDRNWKILSLFWPRTGNGSVNLGSRNSIFPPPIFGRPISFTAAIICPFYTGPLLQPLICKLPNTEFNTRRSSHKKRWRWSKASFSICVFIPNVLLWSNRGNLWLW